MTVDNITKLSSESLSDKETETLLTLLRVQKGTRIFDIIYYILEDPSLLILFLNTMAGDTIKVPSREDILKLIDYVHIYTYYKSLPEQEYMEKCRKTAQVFKRRTQSVQRIVQKVETSLREEVIKDGKPDGTNSISPRADE